MSDFMSSNIGLPNAWKLEEVIQIPKDEEYHELANNNLLSLYY